MLSATINFFKQLKASLKETSLIPLLIISFLVVLGDRIISVSFITYVSFAKGISEEYRFILPTVSVGLFMLPFLIFSASSGKIADSKNKARFVEFLNLIKIPLSVLAAFAYATSSIPLILLCILFYGMHSTFIGTVKFGILPQLVKEDKLVSANGYMELIVFMAILVGAIIGGSIITEGYIISHYAVGFLLTLFAVLNYYLSKFIQDTKINSKEKVGYNFIKDSITLVKRYSSNSRLFLAVLGISWFWLIGSILLSQMLNFTEFSLHADRSVYLTLLTSFTIGTGVGSVFCNRLVKGVITVKYVPISILMMSIAALHLWYSSTLFHEGNYLTGIVEFLRHSRGIWVLVDTFLISFFGGLYIVPLYAFMLKQVKDSEKSQIIAVNNIFNSLFMVAGSLITITLFKLGLYVSTVILIIVLLNFFVALYICKILPDIVLQSFFQFLLKIIYRVEVKGIKNFEKAGDKVLIISNHVSYLDSFIIGTFLPSRVTFAIDTNIANWWFVKPLLKLFRALPVDPTNPMAIKTLIQRLNKGEKIAIFPEGRMTVTGSLMKVYDGPGVIADRAGASVLPIRLEGVEYSLLSRVKRKKKWRLFSKIKMTILEPQKLDIPEELAGLERRRYIGEYLYDMMTNMMFKGHENECSIFEEFLKSKNKFGSRATIITDITQKQFSYFQLLVSAFAIEKELAKHSNFDENIGIMLPNTAILTKVVLACLCGIRIPALLNYTNGLQNALDCCVAAKIRYVYTSKLFITKSNLQNYIEAFEENNISIIYVEDLAKKIGIFSKGAAVFKALLPKLSFILNVKKYEDLGNNFTIHNPAVVLFTSGSEGRPKGVVLSHDNLISNIYQISTKIDYNRSDTMLLTLPAFHSFGFTFGIILPLIYGIKTIYYTNPLHYRIIPELIYYNNVTIFFSADRFLDAYAKHAHPYDFFSVRYVFAGAEKLRDETSKIWMENFGIRILEGYGATEASPALSMNTKMHYRKGSVGRLLPGIQHKIEKVEGIEKGGKLLVKGPNVMLGYLKYETPGNISAPTSVIKGKKTKGWYDTGDIVEIDNDGFINIIGRTSRFIKRGGEMVSMQVVENLIYELSPNNIHAVVRVFDEKEGEKMILCTDDANLKISSIRVLIKEKQYSNFHIPDQLKFLKDFPIIGPGKINYIELEKIIAQKNS